jgi:hypothetical protein
LAFSTLYEYPPGRDSGQAATATGPERWPEAPRRTWPSANSAAPSTPRPTCIVARRAALASSGSSARAARRSRGCDRRPGRPTYGGTA